MLRGYICRCLSSLLLAATLPLVAAGAAATSTLTFPFRSVGHTASGASGQLTVRSLDPRTVLLVLTQRGLIPGTAYVAHDHALGSASTDPCSSDGPITLGFPGFRADAQGEATALLRSEPSRLGGTLGAYVNVHPASGLSKALLCAAVLKTAPTQAAATAPLRQTVKIGDNYFQPASLSVAAGTTVTWTLTGQVTHNVLSLDVAGLRSVDLHPGDSYSHTFKTPGVFTYYCSYHEGMSATITVTGR